MSTPDAAGAAAARTAAMEKVQEVLDMWKYYRHITGYSGYDVELMTKLVLVDAGPEGRVVWELDITDFYGNSNGVMHGGAASVIFDMCSTMALGPLARRGYWDFLGGVSRSINVSYVRAVPINTKVHITARVAQHGRTMALIRAEMTSPDGSKIYATCEHHKVHVPPQESIDELRTALHDEVQRRGGDRSFLDGPVAAVGVKGSQSRAKANL